MSWSQNVVVGESANENDKIGTVSQLVEQHQCLMMHCNDSQPTANKSSKLKVTRLNGGGGKESSGFKQKLVNKVKLWGSKDGKNSEENKSDGDIETLVSQVDEHCTTVDFVKAPDSLDDICNVKEDISETTIVNSKSASFAAATSSSSSHNSQLSSTIRYSDSFLGGNKNSKESNIKTIMWDPWNKIGRKNKKENKRRKADKSPSARENRSALAKGKDESQVNVDAPVNTEDPNLANLAADDDAQETYVYESHPRRRKNVEFTNQVMVVYFVGEEVIGRGTEPLKKELEQQVRNKEMRRGHVPCMMGKKFGENYMSSWFRK